MTEEHRVEEIQRARIFDGEKFLWDGEEYESEAQAKTTEEDYRERGFEVRRVSVEGKPLLYTRRPVSSSESS